jgi:hypothetical protein
MNHIAQTVDMYPYCIQMGKIEDVSNYWVDMQAPSNLRNVNNYLLDTLPGFEPIYLAYHSSRCHLS